MIYIREAHPTDGWWLGGGFTGLAMGKLIPKASTSIRDPRSLPERQAAAHQCQSALQWGIRSWVDELDDTVSTAYAAWPTRLYLLDTSGRVAYRGGPGPFGFSPSALGKAIDVMLTGEAS